MELFEPVYLGYSCKKNVNFKKSQGLRIDCSLAYLPNIYIYI